MTLIQRDLSIRSSDGPLPAHLTRPGNPRDLVVALLGDSPTDRTAFIDALVDRSYAVLQVDLLGAHGVHHADGEWNAAMLGHRLIDVLDFIRNDGDTVGLPVGFYAENHASPAAIRAAAQRDRTVHAVIANGGLIDHAGVEYLEALAAPLLVLVDAEDAVTEASSRRALQHVRAPWDVRRGAPAPVEEVLEWLDRWMHALPGSRP